MKFYGNADLQHNAVENAELTDNIVISPLNALPTAHGVGHIALVNNVLYMCSSVTPTDVWIPLTSELTAYAWEQTTPSTSWSVTHNLNTEDVGVIVYDVASRAIVPDEITITGSNTLTVTFSTAQTGKAVVITGTFEGPPRTNGSNAQIPSQTGQSGKHLSTDGTSLIWVVENTCPSSGVLVVAKNGNNSTGDGSYGKPFATIQHAHDYAESNFAADATVVISIAPGNYAEALSLSRPRTAFTGFAGYDFGTMVTGPITITPSRRVAANPSNSSFSFDNIFLNMGTGEDALTFTGSTYCGMLILNRIRIYTTSGKGIVMNNTATDFVVGNNNRLRWRDVDIFTNNGNQNGIELQNVYGTAKDIFTTTGTAEGIVMNGGLVTFTNSSFENAGSRTLSVSTGATLLMRNSGIQNSQTDADGINLASGATAVLGDVSFGLATSNNSGRAIRGVAGAVLMHSGLSFINLNPAVAANNRVSAAVTRIAALTTLSAV